ncbi:phage tail protein [Undibacterium seohonense]|uniref:Phage tail protein n=1 Tax=Undibacterium seohonense TaxID=1344950 RepID=A0ABR6X2H9_9BURK|nr:tail fiber protein [Undibacterium seohonense]MBC3807169.1 phage tail protein [Undibacterium seohonense]
MSEAFIGETRIFGFDFPPKYWAHCNGQIMSIQQNTALFSLLGTYYGGNGTTTFALPNLQGRTPIHFGSNSGSTYQLAQAGGTATHTLNTNEIPSHQHLVNASNKRANLISPANASVGQSATPMFSDGTPGSVYEAVTSGAPITSNAGNSLAHQNMQPYLALNICIALQGIFPSRN